MTSNALGYFAAHATWESIIIEGNASHDINIEMVSHWAGYACLDGGGV
jgi:hypothetical protein